MAIFGGKKGTKAKKTTAAAAEIAPAPKSAAALAAAKTEVLLAPRITEKAAILSDSSVYVFAVTKDATKPQIAAAVEKLFKVAPRKVTVVNTKGTRVMTRSTGKKGMTRAHKKAYVYLKKGEKIELA